MPIVNKKNNILPELKPINRYRKKEINNNFQKLDRINRKLEPINNNRKLDPINNNRKLDPINNNRKLEPINNNRKLEPINNNNYNVNKRCHILGPLDIQYKPRKKHKKDFIKINIENIKKMERKNYL